MSEKIISFDVKPALLANEVRIDICDDRLEKHASAGTSQVINYADIESSRLVVTSVREYTYYRLDFKKRNRKKFRIAITVSRLSTAKNDPDLANFFNLIIAISDKLSLARPDLLVVYSETRGVKWVMFLMGVLAMLCAASILGLALYTGVSEQKLMKAASPVGLLALFGFFISAMSNPFLDNPKMDWRAFGEIVKTI